jgi:hypothetical protein
MICNKRNKNPYSLGVGISTVFKIVSYFDSLGWVDPRGHDLHNHWMILNTKNKNIYGLWVRISIIFEMFSYFPFLVGGVDPRGDDLHTSG